MLVADFFVDPTPLPEPFSLIHSNVEGRSNLFQIPLAHLAPRVGRYEVISPLGTGGIGEVHRARDTRLHRDVALKLLPGTSDTRT